MLLGVSTHVHGAEWDCTGASNTGSFVRSTDCRISGTATTNGGGVVVTNTLEIAGTVEDMNHLVTITAASKQRQDGGLLRHGVQRQDRAVSARGARPGVTQGTRR